MSVRVIIHSCNKRKWYVEKYLQPSIIEQGINNVSIWNDDKEEGNLKSCMDCFSNLKEEGDTWHLQDDVIISRKFGETLRQYEDIKGIVCGFCSRYSKGIPAGKNNVWNMWYSFTCIRIPNKIARECAEWVWSDEILENYTYKNWRNQGKYDDDFLKEFTEKNYRRTPVYNLNPNIVDHIDYLLGGPVVNFRNEPARALFWEDEDLVIELARKLNENI